MSENLTQNLAAFLERSINVWGDGGWAMYVLAVVSFVMFAVGFHVLFRLLGRGHHWLPERVWRGWIDSPLERRGRIGEMLDFVTGGQSLKGTRESFDAVRTMECPPFDRDLLVMKICVSAAPLVGLLGTVTGMLATFGALASGSGGDQTMKQVASGISEALITTETGLVIALPGLFFQYMLVRMLERYKAFLAHMEAVCMQTLYRKLSSNPTKELAA